MCICHSLVLYRNVPSVLWHCWLGFRKNIQPIKIEWWGIGVVICLEYGANDLHMVQLMPLPPIISCFSKIQNGLPCWCRLTQVVGLPRLSCKRPLNGWVCVCVCVNCVWVCVWYCIETAKLRIMQTMRHDSPDRDSSFLMPKISAKFEWGHPTGDTKCRWSRLKLATFDK